MANMRTTALLFQWVFKMRHQLQNTTYCAPCWLQCSQSLLPCTQTCPPPPPPPTPPCLPVSQCYCQYICLLCMWPGYQENYMNTASLAVRAWVVQTYIWWSFEHSLWPWSQLQSNLFTRWVSWLRMMHHQSKMAYKKYQQFRRHSS